MRIKIILSLLYKKAHWSLLKRIHRNVKITGKAFTNDIKIRATGRGNLISCSKGSQMLHCKISFLGSNNTLIIGANCYIPFTNFYFEGDDNKIIIGNNAYIDGHCEFCATEGSSINVGERCLFARNISIRTTDSHPIYDMDGNRINHVQDIHIGENVWIGLESLILKGSDIKDNCIIGARSLITRSTISESYTIVAGQPAKIIKKNVKRTKKG